MNSPKNRRQYILGCPVDDYTMGETLAEIDRIIKERKPCQHVVVNAGKLIKTRKDVKFKKIIESCEIINADGMAVVWVSRLLGAPLKERVAGIDLMKELVKKSADKGYRIYFLGAKQNIVEKVVGIYRARYGKEVIAGYRNGYWDVSEEESVVEDIKKSGADMLFVGVSSPKKEEFLNRYIEKLNVPFVMGVGGSFDVVAGKTTRAPLFLQKCGLEWLWRFLQEPRRMWKRYLLGNMEFVFLVFCGVINKVKNNGRCPKSNG